MADARSEITAPALSKEDAADMAAVLDRVCESALDWHYISADMSKEFESAPEQPTWLSMAFDYSLRHFHTLGSKESWFVPLFGFDSGESYPPAVRDLPDEVLKAWREILALSESLVARSRLAHLLFERKIEARKHAVIAAEAYLQLASRDWSDELDRVEYLVVATDLSGRVGLDQYRQQGEDALILMAERSLAEDRPSPGIALRLLEAAAEFNPERAELPSMLDRVRSAYADDAHLLEQVIAVQRLLAKGDPEAQRKLDCDRITAWIHEADRAEGLVRVIHLEKAARLARDLGDPDLVQLTQAKLQEIDRKDVELQKITSEVSIPKEVIEAFLAEFTSFESWRDALIYFGLQGPPSGAYEENRRAVDRAKRDAPLSAEVPRVKLGGDGLPRYRPTSEDEILDLQLADQEVLRLQVTAPLLVEALERFKETYGPPSQDELKEFFLGLPAVHAGYAHVLASGFWRFWNDDFEGCVAIVLPQIEARARRLVQAAGRGVYEVQRGQQPGRYPGLAFLLGQLVAGGLEKSWYRFLWTFLASPAGLNFRNEVFHGFVSRFTAGHAVLVLKAATFLALVEVSSEEADDSPDQESDQVSGDTA